MHLSKAYNDVGFAFYLPFGETKLQFVYIL